MKWEKRGVGICVDRCPCCRLSIALSAHPQEREALTGDDWRAGTASGSVPSSPSVNVPERGAPRSRIVPATQPRPPCRDGSRISRPRAPVRTPQGLPSPSRKRRREQRIRPARSDGLVQTRSCGRARGATRVELSRLVGPSTKASRLEIPLCGGQTCRAQRGVGVRRGRDCILRVAVLG